MGNYKFSGIDTLLYPQGWGSRESGRLVFVTIGNTGTKTDGLITAAATKRVRLQSADAELWGTGAYSQSTLGSMTSRHAGRSRNRLPTAPWAAKHASNAGC